MRPCWRPAKFYLGRQGRSPHVPVADILETAVHSMGLGDVQPFDVRKKVIGLPECAAKSLVAMRVADFVDEVSRDTPAPGGGSIAALAGSLGAALASMVANITHNKTHDPGEGEADSGHRREGPGHQGRVASGRR